MIATNKKSQKTKTSTVCKLLGRPRGATVQEIMTATSWQNHSVRAFFTGLRKKGHMLVREERASGGFAYRITVEASGATEAGNVQPQ